MILYVVITGYDWEGFSIRGIYDDPEKAASRVRELELNTEMFDYSNTLQVPLNEAVCE